MNALQLQSSWSSCEIPGISLGVKVYLGLPSLATHRVASLLARGFLFACVLGVARLLAAVITVLRGCSRTAVLVMLVHCLECGSLAEGRLLWPRIPRHLLQYAGHCSEDPIVCNLDLGAGEEQVIYKICFQTLFIGKSRQTTTSHPGLVLGEVLDAVVHCFGDCASRNARRRTRAFYSVFAVIRHVLIVSLKVLLGVFRGGDVLCARRWCADDTSEAFVRCK